MCKMTRPNLVKLFFAIMEIEAWILGMPEVLKK